MLEIISTKETQRLKLKLERIRARNVALDSELLARVAAIIEDVRRSGDQALVEYAASLDGLEIEPADLVISKEKLEESASQADQSFVAALREAIKRVRTFHEFERQHSWEFETENGSRLGQRISALESAGVYVPGGTASYPSSVVMNIVPAQVAGVDRIVVASPPRSIRENPAIAAALMELGVTEIYGVGGAQAIAAFAYGTETVPRVDKITGPGNRYVAAAKKLVFGVCGIDSIAGPTEVIILADDMAPASFVAGDLLAQAEHDEDASAMLLTTSGILAKAVADAVSEQIKSLSRREIIKKSLADYGAIIVVSDLIEACALVNDLAPEHLEIICDGSEEIASRIRHAGAIFLGQHSPEVVGDYIAGPNHVLPTAGTARFSSALGVHDFLKRTSLLKFSASELRTTAPLIDALARAEGLDAHARSARIRLEAEG